MKTAYVIFDSNDGGRVLDRFNYNSENELNRFVNERIEELKTNYYDNAWIVFDHYPNRECLPQNLQNFTLSKVYDRMSNEIRKPDGRNLKDSFDYAEWLKEFKEASHKSRGFRPEREKIFQNTIKLVQSGNYLVKGKRVDIDNKSIFSEYFCSPTKLNPRTKFETRFSVVNADCLETAEMLKNSGLNPCVLNLANRHNPGGGVIKGSGAQEENLFRRTNLFLSMYQFIDYAEQYGIKKGDNSYPLDKKSGGIYTGNATVFRGSENNGYCLLKEPIKMAFVSVPALNHPKLIKVNDLYCLSERDVEYTKSRVRTILRIAGKHKHNCLVLGAFGCGAFRNPPNHIAKVFKEVFLEEEFYNAFKLVIFSIIEDRNSWMEHNPEGNVLPFLNVFDGFRTIIHKW